jgi:hypothetical protein
MKYVAAHKLLKSADPNMTDAKTSSGAGFWNPSLQQALVAFG